MEKYCPGNGEKTVGAPLQLPPPAPPPAADLQVLVQGSVSCEQLHLQRRLFLIFYHLSTKHKFFSDVKPLHVHMWCAVYLTVSERGAQLVASFIVQVTSFNLLFIFPYPELHVNAGIIFFSSLSILNVNRLATTCHPPEIRKPQKIICFWCRQHLFILIHPPVRPCLLANGEKMTFSKIATLTFLKTHLSRHPAAGNPKVHVFREAANQSFVT